MRTDCEDDSARSLIIFSHTKTQAQRKKKANNQFMMANMLIEFYISLTKEVFFSFFERRFNCRIINEN